MVKSLVTCRPSTIQIFSNWYSVHGLNTGAQCLWCFQTDSQIPIQQRNVFWPCEYQTRPVLRCSLQLTSPYSSIRIGYHFKTLKYCLGLLQVCKKMYSGSNDLRSHLKKCHPNIGNNIKPNLPLTPQILVNISVSNESENIGSVL